MNSRKIFGSSTLRVVSYQIGTFKKSKLKTPSIFNDDWL